MFEQQVVRNEHKTKKYILLWLCFLLVFVTRVLTVVFAETKLLALMRASTHSKHPLQAARWRGVRCSCRSSPLHQPCVCLNTPNLQKRISAEIDFHLNWSPKLESNCIQIFDLTYGICGIDVSFRFHETFDDFTVTLVRRQVEGGHSELSKRKSKQPLPSSTLLAIFLFWLLLPVPLCFFAI